MTKLAWRFLLVVLALGASRGRGWAGADDEEEVEVVSPRWESGSMTRLADGRWLLASAQHPVTKRFASFLWCPVKRRWTQADAMTIDRYEHEATLLGDGRVLVTGGYHVLPPDPDEYVDDEIGATAEIFDPRTGRWSDAGTMGEPRRGHTTTLLADGRVLVSAGDDSGMGGLSSAEFWDPRTSTFAPAGELEHPRIGHKAVRLGDGRVLVADGSADLAADTTADAWIWQPKPKTFTQVAPMQEARMGFDLVALEGGGAVAVRGFHARVLPHVPVRQWVLATTLFTPPRSRARSRRSRSGRPPHR